MQHHAARQQGAREAPAAAAKQLAEGFSAHENIPACALENLTISRSAIVRTSLRDGVAGNRCSESLS
jgi:hypothetical protein